jgi:hypothetical protein
MNAAKVIEFATVQVTEVCINCGCLFTMPEALRVELRKNHRRFFCPNGHEQFYPQESDVERLTRELKEMREQKIREAARANVAEAHLADLQKRVRNGVCPCCKRSFANLRRHMATKHPGTTP